MNEVNHFPTLAVMGMLFPPPMLACMMPIIITAAWMDFFRSKALK